MFERGSKQHGCNTTAGQSLSVRFSVCLLANCQSCILRQTNFTHSMKPLKTLGVFNFWFCTSDRVVYCICLKTPDYSEIYLDVRTNHWYISYNVLNFIFPRPIHHTPNTKSQTRIPERPPLKNLLLRVSWIYFCKGTL